MAKKQTKRQFDWKTYSKPPRLLSPAQEDALSPDGMLAPLLDMALQSPDTRFDIRARAANIYYRGANLLRLVGEEPFTAELETAADAPPTRVELHDAGDVHALLGKIEELRGEVDSAWEADRRLKRDYLQVVAESNATDDLFSSEYVVIDIEYTYGRRRYDMVALRRCEGVTGPGGFAHPRLVLVDARVPGQPLTGTNAPEAVAEDLAEYVKAIGGSHLARTREEMVQLVAQKVRLGLLPADLELRSIDVGLPEFLELFAGRSDIAGPEVDAKVIALHERLAARHYPVERLRFSAIEVVPEHPGTEAIVFDRDVMTYREFKDFRARRA